MTEEQFDDLFDPGEQWAQSMNKEYPPAPLDPFSLLPVHEQLDRFKAVVEIMRGQAETLAVADRESSKAAVSLGSQAKKKWKEIEDKRKELVGPPNDFIKAVNRLAKEVQEPLADIERILKKKISEWETKVRLELAKAQEEASQEAKRLQEQINAEAEAAGVTAPVVVTPVLPETPSPIRTEAGSASQRKEWAFEIINPQEVPRDYCMVDERKIREAVKNGIRAIPGVKIFEKYSTIFRT